MFKLSTVRRKLTALVGLSLTATFVALAILWWITDRQVIEEINERIPDAIRGFKVEMDDNVAEIRAAAVTLAESAELEAAVRGGDKTVAQKELESFHDAYADKCIVLYGADGRLLHAVGATKPAPTTAALSRAIAEAARGRAFAGLTPHGCETASDAPLAYVMANEIGGGGLVAISTPIDREYMHNVSAKLGLQLALVAPDGRRIATDGFPRAFLDRADYRSVKLADVGSRTWALEMFVSKALNDSRALARPAHLVAAVDVTDIRAVVRNNLAAAALLLALAGLLILVLGARLARVMSDAIGRVSEALKRIERDDYVHIEAVETGDELEDLATGFNAMVDGLRERDRLRTTFGKYMTQTVMEHLLAGRVQLGGETLTVTILFSDIRSFTTISEKMDAQQLVGLLNEYFTEMVSIVMQESGVVDKYIGDAIMAVFGAPVPKSDDAERAVRAAVRMRGALAQLNRRLSGRGVAPLRTGVGIHTGEVVAGNIGSEARMEYTVIGDAVNLASRLESSTKELDRDVLISEDTYELVKDICVAEPVKQITVKGRAQPVMTYAVTALTDETREPHDR